MELPTASNVAGGDMFHDPVPEGVDVILLSNACSTTGTSPTAGPW